MKCIFFTDRCPMKDGYIHFRNTSGCYKPYPTTSGSYTCVTDGGHLVKINDVTEKEAIKSVLGASNG